MTYLPADRILWDFWFAPHQPGQPFTLFHLDAPRDLPDPEDRHLIAEIGQAVSDDLVHWRRVGVVFGRGEPGAWDSRAIWTGCCVRHEGLHSLFYTALGPAEPGLGLVQRIGVATSPDLRTWTRHSGNPILTADPRWYETAADHPRGDETLRDPFVLWDETRGEWLMVYCSRANDGPFDARGVIGAARSRDLLAWEPLPPLDAPREFAQLEVPQLVSVGGRWRLVFCTPDHGAERLARTGPAGKWFGTHYLTAEGDDPRGPYRLDTEPPLLADAAGTWYAGRIETGLAPEPRFFAWRRLWPDGSFCGGLSDPVPVRVGDNGDLGIDPAALWPVP